MTFLKKIASFSILCFMVTGLALSDNEGPECHLLSVSKEVLKADNTEDYQEYYFGYSSKYGYRVIFDELYINLEKDLRWCWKIQGIAKGADQSLKTAYENSLISGNALEGTFAYTENGNSINLYTELETLVNNEASDNGYVHVTQEMVSVLNTIGYNIASKNKVTGDINDFWDTFCFYKGEDDPEGYNPFDGDSTIGELKLVYGDSSLKDEDAFTFLIMGDGFTASDQTLFYEKAVQLANYMMETSPYDEFSDCTKIYALGVCSNESGISNDVDDSSNIGKNLKDTYFGTSFWSTGMERLISVSALGLLKMNSIVRYLVPDSDYAGLLCNSTRYGGSGGTYCTCSLREAYEDDVNYQGDAREIFIHEIAHTIANLADEYNPGTSYYGEYPNMTKSSNKTLTWEKFLGADDGNIGEYAYTDDLTQDVVEYLGTTWIKPTDGKCKMQLLGKNHPFCAVCKEALRINICKNTTLAEMYYQPYNNEFGYNERSGLVILANKEIISKVEKVDILPYIIVRKGEKSITLDQVDSSLVSVTYYDENGNETDNFAKAGNYSAAITFKGSGIYTAKNYNVSFSVKEYADLSELKTLTESYNALDDSLYTDESYKELENLLKTANKASTASSQEEIDTLVADLKTAYGSLVLKKKEETPDPEPEVIVTKPDSKKTVTAVLISCAGTAAVMLFGYWFFFKRKRKLKKRL